MLSAATATPDDSPGSTDPATTPTPSATPSGATGEVTPSTTPTLNVTETVEVIQETTVDFLTIAWKAGLGAVIGLAVVFVVLRVLRMMGGRRRLYAELARFGRNAGYMAGALTGAYLGAQAAVLGQAKSSTHQIVLHVLLIAVILAATWLAASTTRAVETTVVKSVRASSDVGRTNRVTTQAQILRRVVEVIVIACGLVGAIMTFPSARFAMGSLFASAGLVSVIAGLAARSTLSNVFAGIQLASTDAIRVGDLVVANTEQGTIEEITLAYVVMRTWDDRRMVLPSTYFTENPFENWSRGGTQTIGTFTLELDWRAPIAALRVELARIMASSTVWDGRQATLEVADAVGGILEQNKLSELKEILLDENPIDIADLFEEFPKEKCLIVFKILPKDLSSEVFSYLSPEKQQEVIENITDEEIRFIMDEMYLDDTVDFIEEMPANIVELRQCFGR